MQERDGYTQPVKLTGLMTLVENEYALTSMILEVGRRIEATAALRESLADHGDDHRTERNVAARQTELLENLEETLQAVRTEAKLAKRSAACGYGAGFHDDAEG